MSDKHSVNFGTGGMHLGELDCSKNAGIQTEIRPDSSSPPSKKKWVPLESDPVILTQYTQRLGLSPSLAFHDVYSISDPDLLSFVPRPAHALVLCFPVTDVYENYREEQDKGKELDMGEHPVDGDVVWFRQTIGNACGTMGVIHSVFNGEVPSHLEPNTPLSDILQKAKTLNPQQRTKLLENSDELDAAHTSFAQQGQTKAPGLDDFVENHYVALVKHVNPKTKKTMLYELDGCRKGPVERAELPAGEDLLGPTALKIVDEFMNREMESGKSGFSLCALAPSLE